MLLDLRRGFVSTYSWMCNTFQHSPVSLRALWHPLSLFPQRICYTFGSGMSLLGSFSAISSIILWLTFSHNSCSVIAVNKSLPLCNLWEEEKRNHGDNRTGCGSKRETQKPGSQSNIHQAVLFLLWRHEKILENLSWYTAARAWGLSSHLSWPVSALTQALITLSEGKPQHRRDTRMKNSCILNMCCLSSQINQQVSTLQRRRRQKERGLWGKPPGAGGGVCRDWLSSRILEWIKSHTGHFGKSVSLGK